MPHYYIGTDEAGYGPNLGPLLICATLWESTVERDCEALYEPLGGVVSPDGGGGTVRIADSKKVHQKANPAWLERAVFVPMGAMGLLPLNDADLWLRFAPAAAAQQAELPWYDDTVLPLPLCADLGEIESLRERLSRRFDETGFRLKRILAMPVFPRRFNAMVDETGSKGVLLSNETMRLVVALASGIDEGTVHVVCDKHGGRNKYRPLLESHFEEAFVEIYEEGRACSLYRFGPAGKRFEFTFRTKAEACLPVALASCVAKYLRELAMHRFNAFWQRYLPDLKPTAGYPDDARRFREEIESTATRLNLEPALYWRNR